jgi:antitoxin VapB
MASARVFKSGNSQAVRLPKEFRFSGAEVEIFRRGDEIVLREKTKGMERAFWLLANLPIDVKAIKKSARSPRKNEKGCNGPTLLAGHQYLHLHPATSASRRSDAIYAAECG